MIKIFDNSIYNMYNELMKIILLIIPSIIYSARTSSNKTYHITKEVSQKLNNSIPLLKNISNKSPKILYFNIDDFEDIKNTVSLIGEMSQKHLNVSFSIIKNLEQLNNFNKEIIALDNIETQFINIVISLINQIFQSIPEEDVEISNESNCLMRFLKMDNPNKITISVTHKWHSTQITFNFYLNEDNSKNIARTSNPNEEEEEVSKLLDKKEQ